MLDERFDAAERAGVDAAAYSDPARIATAMMAAIPSDNVYDRTIGPFYDTPGLVEWLGISKQAIAKRVHAGTLIGCQLETGNWVYPIWQFTSEGTVDQQIIQVWKTLRTGGDPWTCALWMRVPAPEFGAASAVD